MKRANKKPSTSKPDLHAATRPETNQASSPIGAPGSIESYRKLSALLTYVTGNQAEQEVLSQALTQMNEAVLVLDKNLHAAFVNDAYCRQMGAIKEELIGRSIAELGQPPLPEMPPDPAGFEAWIRERGFVRGEMVMLSGDGKSFPAFISITPIFNAEREILAYVITQLDLRQIKQAEVQLRESEGTIRAISSATQDAILMLDDNGRIVFWNDAARHVFGYSANEALGQNVHLFLAPSRYHDAYANAWPRFAKDGKGPVLGKVLELEAVRKDGTEFPIELSVSAVPVRGTWHAVGILRDVTERKKKERELRLFRELLDHSNDAIEVIDPESLRFLDVNERGCRDLGYTRDELLSMTVIDIDPTFGPETKAMIDEQVKRSGAAVLERIHHRKDGSAYPVEISLRFVEVEGKTYVMNMVRDVTDRKRTEESLQRNNRALRTISACNMTLVHARDEQQLLEDMCRTVVEQGGYHLAWIGFAEHGADKRVRPVAKASAGGDFSMPPPSWADDECGQPPASLALRLGTTQIARDIPATSDRPHYRQHALDHGYKSCLALPLKEDGSETFGVLNICSADKDSFDDDEVRLLEELAADLAFGVLTLRTRQQRDHYQQESVKNLDRLKGALLGTVSAVARMAEQRDPYTAGHQARVADLACAIAQELGLGPDRVEGLRLGALIHDIGKISIPAEILNRPGKLSAAELEIIKTHAQAGFDIIKDIDFPWPVARMVLQHHERLDGSGYPKGLKGEAICLEARILGVADVVDAVSAHRPYRPSRGINVALNILEAERGKRLDADVVDACLSLIRKKGYALDKTQEPNGSLPEPSSPKRSR